MVFFIIFMQNPIKTEKEPNETDIYTHRGREGVELGELKETQRNSDQKIEIDRKSTEKKHWEEERVIPSVYY